MIMFQSTLRLNRRHPLAQLDLGDRYELHRTVLSAFPQPTPPEESILFRLESVGQLPYATILVQSLTWPDWDNLEGISGPGYFYEAPAVRTVDSVFEVGLRLRFLIHANATVKRGGKNHAIRAADNLSDWLARKGQQHGFRIDASTVRILKLGKQQTSDREKTWHVVQFSGALQVIQSEEFRNALRYGVGRAKRFGCGLLTVRYLAGSVAGNGLAAQHCR